MSLAYVFHRGNVLVSCSNHRVCSKVFYAKRKARENIISLPLELEYFLEVGDF